MGWSFDIAVTTTHKYAVRDSGDVIEIVETPDGGLGIVVADGQGSGSSARLLARSVARRAALLLSEGVRPQAVVQAACDALYAERGGKVSVSLDVVHGVRTGEFEIARASTNQLILHTQREWQAESTAEEPAGRQARQEPGLIYLQTGAFDALLIVTDGVAGAGERFGSSESFLERLPAIDTATTAESLADAVFAQAMALDRGRPNDDMSVVALLLSPGQDDQRIERRRARRSVR